MDATSRTSGKFAASTCVRRMRSGSSANAGWAHTNMPASRTAKTMRARDLNIDRRDPTHQEEAEEDHECRGDGRESEHALEQQRDVVTADEEERRRDEDRQERKDVRGVALLRGERANVAVDPLTLA